MHGSGFYKMLNGHLHFIPYPPQQINNHHRRTATSYTIPLYRQPNPKSIMPSLIPKADENLDPNQRISIVKTKTNAISSSLRSKRLSALPTGKRAAVVAMEMSPSKNQRSKPRFRENAPHVVGKRVKFHDAIHPIGESTTTTASRQQITRKLAHFARLYSQPFADHSDRVDEPIYREFIHSTHRERKQAIAYSNYINHLLSPHGHCTVPKLPSGVHSALLLHRQATAEKCAAKFLYESCPMRTMRSVIDREVGRGRLTMRLDRDMDVWMQKELVGVFMSYGGRWLKLGLELVLGEAGEISNNKHTLEKIIIQRILSDPTTIKKYTGGGRVKTPSGKYETALRQMLQHHAMTKMLTVVTFLDMAKSHHILSEDPCLFEKESRVKSSSQVLASICRICFARDEFILHHLAHLGIVATHVQNPLEEYEFYVRNLANDLKDGVRLAKLAEMLTNRPLLTAMRLPATCRGHKMHNVGEALSALKRAGVENIDDVIPAHIVDAHQPRILQLLWGTIVHFQVRILEEDVIQAEIDGICRWMEKRRAGGCGKAAECYHGVNAITSTEEKQTRSFERIKSLLLKWCQTVCSFYDVPVENFTSSFSDGKILCFLISFYHPTMLPCRDILPTASDVQSRLKQGVDINEAVAQMALRNEQYNLSLALNKMDALGGIPKLFSTKNFLLPPDENTIILCVSFLFSRLTETSQEIVAARVIQKWWHRSALQKKRVAATIIFAHWRLLKDDYFRNQRSIFASPVRVIESFYKRHEIKFKELARNRAIRKKRDESAAQIQSLARKALASNLFRNKLIQDRASKLIQSYCRIFLAKNVKIVLQMHKSSGVIQKIWRSSRIQFAYQFVRKGVTSCQSLWRSYCCRVKYEIARTKLIILQSVLRRYLVFVHLSNVVASNFRSRSFFRQYLCWRNGKHCPYYHFPREREDAMVQSLFRLVESRGMMNSQAVKFYSALHIQSIYLGFVTRRNVKTMGIASTEIQRIWRRYQAQLAFGFDLMDIIAVQSIGRRYLAGRLIKRRHDMATTIQRIWRGYRGRLIYSFTLIDITTSQSIARRFIARQHVMRQLAATNTIQFFWRGYQARNMYCHKLILILKTQSIARRFIYQCLYLKQRRASILIQSTARQWLAMRSRTKAINSAISVQSSLRAFKARRWLEIYRTSAVTIQTFSRGVIAKKIFRRIHVDNVTLQGRLCRIRHRLAALTIQCQFRQWLVCRSHRNAIAIQQVWRGHSDRQLYRNVLMRIVAIQSQVRRLIAERTFAKLKSEYARKMTVQHYTNKCLEANSPFHESCYCIKDISASEVHELSEGQSFVVVLSSSSESIDEEHIATYHDRIENQSSEKWFAEQCSIHYLDHGETKTSQENSQQVPKEVCSFVNRVPLGVVVNDENETNVIQLMNPPLEIMSRSYNHNILEIEKPSSVLRENQKVLEVNTDAHSSGHVIERDEMHVVSEGPSLGVIKSPPRSMSDTSAYTHHINKRIVEASTKTHDDRSHDFSQGFVEVNAQQNSVISEGKSILTTQTFAEIPVIARYLHRSDGKRVVANGLNMVMSNNSESKHEARHISQGNSPLDLDNPLESERTTVTMVDSSPNNYRTRGVLDTPALHTEVEFDSIRTTTKRNIHEMAKGLSPLALHTDFSTNAHSRNCCLQVPEMVSFDREEKFCTTQEEINTSSMAAEGTKRIQTQSHLLVNSKNHSTIIDNAMRPDASYPQGRCNQEGYASKCDNLDYNSTKHQMLRHDSLEEQEIKCGGVLTRYKVSMASALEFAEAKAEQQSYYQLPNLLRPTEINSVLDVTTRSRSSSLDLDRTHKALELVGKSHLLSEVKEAIKIIENTTGYSKECRNYFTQVKGQITLCSLITSCNRSSPHLELIRMILKTLTNVAKHRSTVHHLAKNEIVEVIIYVCQMYRDKTKLLALSSSLLDVILRNCDHNIMAIYSTPDQKMRLHGILSLCKKRASHSGSKGQLTKGIASLENVVRMVDQFI